jgi:hypothetical protein
MAALDWEFARIDPVVMDLAQPCCTLLIYLVHSGQVVSLASVHNYDYSRERQERVRRYEHVLGRQPERLRSVGIFVGAL